MFPLRRVHGRWMRLCPECFDTTTDAWFTNDAGLRCCHCRARPIVVADAHLVAKTKIPTPKELEEQTVLIYSESKSYSAMFTDGSKVSGRLRLDPFSSLRSYRHDILSNGFLLLRDGLWLIPPVAYYFPRSALVEIRGKTLLIRGSREQFPPL
jgi:hypothetical protein